jgi:hypothetical protein
MRPPAPVIHDPYEAVLDRLRNVKRRDGKATARCPGHDDRTNSLSIALSDDGVVLVKCFAGCKTADVLAKVGLGFEVLYPDGPRTAPRANGRQPSRSTFYKYPDEDGRLLYEVERQETATGKTFRPRKPKPGGGHDYTLGDVRRVPYRLPDLLRAVAAGMTVLYTEGEKDVDRLVGLGYAATTHASGAGGFTPKVGPAVVEALAGADVLLLPDNDRPGYALMAKVYDAIVGVANSVNILRIVGLPQGSDVSDYLDRMGGQGAAALGRIVRGESSDEVDDEGSVGLRTIGRAELARLAGKGEPTATGEPTPADALCEDDGQADRPTINVSGETLTASTERAWAAVRAGNDPAEVFGFGVPPVPVRVSRAGGTPSTQTLSEDRLRNRLDRAASWVKTTSKGDVVPIEPPLSIVRNMLADATYPLPPLLAITEVPTFAPDGTYASRPGYHAGAQTYYAPAPGFSMPEIEDPPSPAAIRAARELILGELLVDFPFTGDAEKANAVALLIQPFARRMIDGPTPFMLIEKPAAGTGATLLAEVVALITTGRSVGAMSEGRDEDEWRKRLTAKLRSAPSIIMIDNIRRRLDSAVVASALTATEIEDRVLGTSDNIRLPVQCTWIGTGNNPALSSEMTRRTVRIRLDAKRDRPWLREEFRHDPLIPWVRKERGAIVAACLTLVRAWAVAGRPTPANRPTLGSYESWSRVMGGILEVAGIDGFLGNLDEFYEASDTEGADIRAFLAAWWEQHGAKPVLAAQLYPLAIADGSSLDIGDKGEQSQKIRLGKLLSTFRDRHYQLGDDLTVCVTAGAVEHRTQTWRLVSSNPGGVGGVGGVSQRFAGENQEDPSRTSLAGSGEKHPPTPPTPPALDHADGFDDILLDEEVTS